MRQKSSLNRAVRFTIGMALLVVCWMMVLPALSNTPAMRQELDRCEAQGINAGAMFYSELKAMPLVMDRMDQVHAEHGSAFWQLSAANKRP